MYDFPIALQLYSVRTDMEADFEGTLKKVKELGYAGVEFAGLYGKSVAEVKKLCEEIGLAPISAHVPYSELLKGEETFKAYAEIGCKYIVIPWIGAEYLAGGEKNAEFIENVKKFGELANANGMKLCYHNHDFEFQKVDGEYKLDRLYSDVSADLLLTQLDTCWVNVGGENPSDYIRKYNGRIEIIHLKDFVGGKSENMYGLIGADGKEKAEDTSKKFKLRPVGCGVQNFPAILDACKEVGATWVVVEQDEPSMGKTRLECAEVSINYLKSL
ncbi:MAG: sugar phosphate isomerase/epimerase [Acutalibacteraceae bacterium]|nr:sugar phosphate isomerase/epimerase [Acutalibacteraceae bacterium]